MSDEVTGYPGAPPDWYPDPAGGPGKRWWDGYAWTDGVVLPTQPPAPPTGAPAPGTTTGYGATRYATPTRGNAPVLLDGELRISQLARAAVVIIGIYYLWEFINLQLESSLYRSIGHQYHRMIVARENNQPVPHLDFSNHANSGLVALGGLLGLATIGAVVVACMWQYRAASTARALGYAAKHSPGWGVGCWFVPIVALWMPYQALRDCLPPTIPTAGWSGPSGPSSSAKPCSPWRPPWRRSPPRRSRWSSRCPERCSASGCCPPLPASSPPSRWPTGTPSVARPENSRVGVSRQKPRGSTKTLGLMDKNPTVHPNVSFALR
jgi:hypothetical protein